MMLKLLFTGDFAPCWRFEKITRSSCAAVFGDLRDDIANADISFVNLETPLCLTECSIDKSGPTIKAHPDCIKSIAEAGFNVVGLANNHIFDYGELGLQETLSGCQQAGLLTCGAGSNIFEAQKPLFVEKQGMKVAFVAVAEHEFSIAGFDRSGAAPLDPIDNIEQIDLARQSADLVFVTVHGGNEYFPYPRPGLRKLCHYFIDRGADGVICHHPHVPGAYEFYNGMPIIYSLGNLVFDHQKPPPFWEQGYALRLEYGVEEKKLIAHDIIPYTQSVEQQGVSKMKGLEKKAFFERLISLNKSLVDAEEYDKCWDEFCFSRSQDVLLSLFSPFRFRGMLRLAKFIPVITLILPKSKLHSRLNMIRCESHKELLLNILENKC